MEGVQQGDRLRSLEFCEAVQPLLTSLHSEVKIGFMDDFMDDFTLSGDLRTVENDVLAIMDSAAETGLQLNQAKCEIIMDDFTLISASSTFSQFIRTKKDEMLLLGVPVIKGKAHDTAIRHKTEELHRAVQGLSLLRAHDALSLLKNSLATPKLLYLLRTADCSGNQLLDEFDNKLQASLSKVLNVDLNND